MDLGVCDMNAFLQDEHLPHGDELDKAELEGSLDHLQSSTIDLAPVGDFQALLRHARGKGHCDGAQFDLFANDLKHGLLRPGSSNPITSPGPSTPPGSPPVVPSTSSDAPLPASWHSVKQTNVFDSARQAEINAGVHGNLTEDTIDDERLGVGHLVLGSHDPTFNFQFHTM
jgi:hypothetical protein